MLNLRTFLFAIVLLVGWGATLEAEAKKLTVGVAQTVIADTLDENTAKISRFIDDAKARGCHLVIFPEGALYWSDIAIHQATKADLDAAMERIGRRARQAGVYVIFGTSYKSTDDDKYHNRGVVYDPAGNLLVFYRKNRDVPQRFFVHGVPCNLSICSDRGYLEHSDLPCLVQGSQVIIDSSGGHGGDDGRPDLRWIRYRPWATRTNAYVIVSNPVHENTDFMGHSPWGGGSAVVRPDGSIQASRTHEKDVILVEQIDTDQATRLESKRRTAHPLFRSYWEAGKRLLEEGTIEAAPKIVPYTSAECPIRIAAVQMACSRNMQENTSRILRGIAEAARRNVDIVAFPELAVTGARADDIASVTASQLDTALTEIRNAARANRIHVIVGMPYRIDDVRRNCAFVIGDDGSVKTQYAQIAGKRRDLFRPGNSAKSMWFSVKGVHAIVTIGDDSNWIEIADLAASRGMHLHFHLSYEADTSADATTLRTQRNLLFMSYAKFGLVVNAADPSRLTNPSAPAHGGSMIVSREGGHNQPAPDGLEYYLPYQTSVVCSASSGEAVIHATRTTTRTNDLDLNRYWRNRNRRARQQRGWLDWVTHGAGLITKGSLP
ncbi:MAG: carbon-nitrogen hydrolase family protein [Planctomycetota bacterium]|jgi:predicted amidohydrolase